MRALEDRMTQVESDWQKKISAVSGTHSILEEIAAVTGRRGPRTQEIEELKLKLAHLKAARQQAKARMEEGTRSSSLPACFQLAPPTPTPPEPVSKKRVRWVDHDASSK